ncbi:MAG: hypothetical protein H7Z41_07580 [Cytophagales bacterium]|nr:hypothetical protein [Armatimonadota bacterium]
MFPSGFQRLLRPGIAVSALLPFFALSGCGGGGGGEPSPIPTGSGAIISQPGWTAPTPTRALTPKKWTFLVYLNAANDLERFAANDTNQMEQIGSTNDVNIVLQYKRIRYFDPDLDDTKNGDWTGTRRYYVTRDNDTEKINSPLLSQSSSIDMGRAQTLQEFVRWGVAAFPAERVCLVIWNHGAGWRSRSAGGSPITRGVSYDDVTGSAIDTIQIPGAINIDRKWDIVAFDSSLMQMAEVAYEIRNQASFIVGSEESPPGDGYYYDRLMANLTGNPNQTTRAFASFIAQDTLAAYTANTGITNITHSALDAAQVGAIAPAMNALGTALTAAQTTWGSQIASARRSSESYGDNRGGIDYTQNKDLVDFLDKLAPVGGTPAVNNPGVVSAVQGVRNVLAGAIISNARGTGHPRSNGLAIYIPSPTQFLATEEQQNDGFGQPYGALSFSQAAPAWRNFLQTGPP